MNEKADWRGPEIREMSVADLIYLIRGDSTIGEYYAAQQELLSRYRALEAVAEAAANALKWGYWEDGSDKHEDLVILNKHRIELDAALKAAGKGGE